MGFYDVNCALTGIGLGYSEAVLVPLRGHDNATYRPMAIPLRGQYDRLGAIDLEDTANTELIAAYLAALPATRLVVRNPHGPAYPSDTIGAGIEGAIADLERNTTVWLGDLRERGEDSMVELDGEPLVFTLISPQVWDAIITASADELAGVPAEQLLAELAGPIPVLKELYAAHTHVDQIATGLRELTAVDRFLKDRQLPWSTHVEGDFDFGMQQGVEELQWWLAWAYEHRGADPVLRAALDAHAADVERLRREDEDEQQQWAATETASSPSAAEMLARLDAMTVEKAIALDPDQ